MNLSLGPSSKKTLRWTESSSRFLVYNKHELGVLTSSRGHYTCGRIWASISCCNIASILFEKLESLHSFPRSFACTLLADHAAPSLSSLVCGRALLPLHFLLLPIQSFKLLPLPFFFLLFLSPPNVALLVFVFCTRLDISE